MARYSEELARRRREEQQQQDAVALQMQAKREKTRSSVLLAGIIAAVLAVLVVAPMRLRAIAGEEIDPVEMYVATNVDENITEAENEVEATLAAQNSNSFQLFAESIQATSLGNLSTTEHQIRMKFLEVDSALAQNDITFDDVFASEENVSYIIAQYENSVPLLDPGEKSLYYVAMIDTSSFNGYGQVKQAIFAENNDDGQRVEDVIYDPETGIAYIPKSYYGVEVAQDTGEAAPESITVSNIEQQPTDQQAPAEEQVAEQQPVEEQAPAEEQVAEQQVEEQPADAQQPQDIQGEAVITEGSDLVAEGQEGSEQPSEDVVGGEVKTEEVNEENGTGEEVVEYISDEDKAAIESLEDVVLPEEIQPMSDEEAAALEPFIQVDGEEVPEGQDVEMSEEEIEAALADELVVNSPIQGQLLISYDLSDTLDDTVNIPISVVSEVGNVQTPDIYELNVPSFDITIPIQLATPETAGNVNPNNVLIYEGGNDIPEQLSEDTGEYDPETGILTLYTYPLSATSFKVVIASDDTLTQALDLILGTQQANATSANDMKAWPQGKFTNLDINKVKDLIKNKKVLSYNANTALNPYHSKATKGASKQLAYNLPDKNWASAMLNSRPYLYAQYDRYGNQAWLDGDAIANAIKNGTDWSKFNSLTDTDNWGQRNQKVGLVAVADRSNGSYENGGTLTGVFSLPGDTGNGKDKIATSIGGVDWSGLRSLASGYTGTQKYVMAGGCCCNVAKASGKGYKTYTSGGKVQMRPLYLDPNGQYIIIGFVAEGASSSVPQAYTGVYKFKVDSKKQLSVQKKTNLQNVTSKYPKLFAKNGEGAIFGVYKSKAEASKGALSNNKAQSPAVGTLTVKNTGVSNAINLDAGTYWLMELKAPNGYKKLTSPVSIKVDKKPTVATITNNPEISNKFRLKKVSANTDITSKGEGTAYAKNCSGAVYGVYKTEAEAKAATADKPGSPVQKLTVKDDSYTDYYSVTEYNRSYWVKELVAPKGYMLSDAVTEVKITVNASVTKEVKDTPITGSVEVNKVDAETNQAPKEGEFEFALLDKDQKEISGIEHKKSVNGAKVSWDGLALGTYYVKEVAASYPYSVNTQAVKVDITAEATKNGTVAVSATVPNNQLRGTVTLTKTDSQDGATIDGATFKLTAAQDVIAPDGTVRYKKDQEITVKAAHDDGVYDFDATATRTEMKTAAGGKLVVRNLYLGKGDTTFTFTEVAPGDGHVLNSTPVTATLKSGGTEAPSVTAAIQNEPNAIDIYKKALKDDSPVEGVTIAFWKSEDDVKVSKPGSGAYDSVVIRTPSSADAYKPVIVKRSADAEGSLNATVAWDASQNAWIASDLAASAGAEYRIEIGGHTVKVIKTSENGGTIHYGRYSDSDSGLFANGWLDQGGLPTSDDKIITKATIGGKEYAYGTTTDAEGHLRIERLPVGDYTLVEAKVPAGTNHKGYLADSQAHHFNVQEGTGLIKDTDDLASGYHEGTEGEYAKVQKFLFKDDVTKLNVSKREITGGPEIDGATLTLTAADNNDVIEEWVSGKEPHYIEALQPGAYLLTERITPNDYDKAETIRFTVYPTGDIQHVEMIDAPINIDAEIDKRQEIAKPLDERYMENGDGKNRAKVQDSKFAYFDYSLDFRSNSNSWTDEFTVEDPLDLVNDDMGRLVSISTPQAWQDYDGKMNVWYKTNKTVASQPAATGDQQEKTGTSDKAQAGTAQAEATAQSITDADAQSLSKAKIYINDVEFTQFDPKVATYDLKFDKGIPANVKYRVENLPSGWTIKMDSSKSKINSDGSASIVLNASNGKSTYAYTVNWTPTAEVAAQKELDQLSNIKITVNGQQLSFDPNSTELGLVLNSVPSNGSLECKASGYPSGWNVSFDQSKMSVDDKGIGQIPFTITTGSGTKNYVIKLGQSPTAQQKSNGGTAVQTTDAGSGNVNGATLVNTAKQQITASDAQALSGVKISVGGREASFDPSKVGTTVDVTGLNDVIEALRTSFSKEGFGTGAAAPTVSGLPDGWTHALGDASSAASGYHTDNGTTYATFNQPLTIANDKHSYTYTLTYSYMSTESTALRNSANATRSDGHENPWLDDAEAMKRDTDHDGRITDYTGWELWRADVSTMASTNLDVKALNLADDEYVTAVRFEYGRVEAGFTTRPDEWGRELEKDAHDDVDDVASASDKSFANADKAADSATSAISRIVSVFTSKASQEAEADIKGKTEGDKIRYEKLLKEIEEYNAKLDQESELPEKFLEAIQNPAYEGEDDAGQKIATTRDAAKTSIVAAFSLDDTAEGRLVLRKALNSAISEVRGFVSADTLAAMQTLVNEYDESYAVNDPERYAAAKEGILGGLGTIIDQIADTGLAGRIHYAPAVLHMQATDKYVAGSVINNSVKVDSYRNGGGDRLEGHDDDKVTQAAKERAMEIATVLTGDGKKQLDFNLDEMTVDEINNTVVNFVDTVTYSGLQPGTEYVIIGELHSRRGETDAGVVNSDGRPVRSQVVFTPTSDSGTIEVPMKAHVGDFQPYPVVAFEELRISENGIAGDKILAEHKDIKDAAQTVDFSTHSADIVTPTRRLFQGTPLAQTGDAVVFGSAIAAAAAAAAGIVIFRRHRRA